jgi:hypothetical protein
MRPHPRIRKTAKWGALSLFALSCAGWVTGRFAIAQWGDWQRGYVSVCGGDLVVEWPVGGAPDGPPRRLLVVAGRGGSRGRPIATRDATHWLVVVPLWLAAGAAGAVAAAAWALDARSRRRAMAGRCARCGYDCAGLAVGVPCPECGHTPTPPPPAPAA